MARRRGGLPNVPVTDLEYRAASNSLYAATFGRGIVHADTALSRARVTARTRLRRLFLKTGTSITAPRYHALTFFEFRSKALGSARAPVSQCPRE